MNIEEFQKTVLPLKNKLFRFALSVVSNKELAEDLVQDAFVKLWKSKDNMQQVGNMEAWSMRMVKNLCLDHFKSKYNKTNTSLDQSVNFIAAPSDPIVEMEYSDTMTQIQLILDTLPEKQRMIFQLREIEEHSYKEIAEILKVDIGDVKVNLHRTRKTIKEKLEKAFKYGLQ